MSTIDEIKTRLNIVDLVSETVQLRKSGKNYTGFCPFHSNTRTPAFVVFPDSGTWRCFGQCNDGGDIFKFIMKKEGWDFPEALRSLAERTGVQLKPYTPQQKAVIEEHEQLRLLLEEAVTFYRHNLLNTPPGNEALAYLRKRGLKDETIEAFGLGYAPHSWDTTLSHLKSRNYTEKDLLDAGMVSERDGGGLYDRFRHRIMFPIRDERGRMTGFGARILNPDDLPKFLNSPQTVLFDKGRQLYGLDRARKDIRSLDQAVIVEGYLDVIALHQAGYANAISPMGTALTEHQLYLLKRYTRRIVLALDADAAGAKATLRGLEIARQAMDRESDLVFDARGLLSHEARLQADIRVTMLPEGLDPDEVVNREAKEWERILAEARPIVIHVMETLAAGRDLEDPKTKSEIARQVLPLIADVPDAVERETYRQRLARLLRVDERALESQLRPATRSSSRQRIAPASSAGTALKNEKNARGAADISPVKMLEEHCLSVLMRRPDLVFHIDRAMQEHGLPRLSSQDFESSEHKEIFQVVYQSLEQDLAEPTAFLVSELSLPMMDKADELLALSKKIEPVEDRLLGDLMRAILNLRLRHIRQNLEYYRFLMEDAQQEGDLLVKEFNQRVQQFSALLRRLNQALGKYTGRTESVN